MLEVIDSSGAFQRWKRIKKHVLPRCHHSPQPETLRCLRGGLFYFIFFFFTSGTEAAGFTPKLPEVSAAEELDELNELYKKDFET